MFDIAWSELLVIGIVALIVVGPKELPNLLRTVGKVLGAVRRQASEFRAQFDEAMRDTEFDKIKQDIEGLRSDAENTIRSAGQSIKDQFDDAIGDPDRNKAVDHDADAHDADGLPIVDESSNQTGTVGVAGSAAAAAAAAASEVAETTSVERSNAASPTSSSAASAASAAASKAPAAPADDQTMADDRATADSETTDKLPLKAGA